MSGAVDLISTSAYADQPYNLPMESRADLDAPRDDRKGLNAPSKSIATILIRGTDDGAVEILVSGIVTKTYPKGSLYLSGPSPAFLDKREKGREAKKAFMKERAELFRQHRAEEAETTEETAKAAMEIRMEDEKERAVAKERVLMENVAISVQDSKTGDLLMAVPVRRLAENNHAQRWSKASQRSDRVGESKAVNVWDPRQSMWIKAVPLEVFEKDDEPEN